MAVYLYTAQMLTRIGGKPALAVEHGGEGPLVVFLHGIGGNRSNWREQLDALTPRFQVAAWDARGYGDSDDYEGALDFGDFSRDLARVLDHFGERAAHLVGLSMGGMIAQDFYRRFPDRVLSMVLADTRNGFQRHNSEEFLRKREAPLLAGLTPADIAPELANTLASASAPPAVRERLRASIARLHKDSYLKTLRVTSRLGTEGDLKGREAFLELEQVRVPVLVICGGADSVTPPPMSEEIVRRTPGARYVLIEGAGHLSNIENPAAFNAALASFL